jgi:hypothetical protein
VVVGHCDLLAEREEYGLHFANVATREFALYVEAMVWWIKQRQMFEGTTKYAQIQTK